MSASKKNDVLLLDDGSNGEANIHNLSSCFCVFFSLVHLVVNDAGKYSRHAFHVTLVTHSYPCSLLSSKTALVIGTMQPW